MEDVLAVLVALALITTPPPLSVFREEAIAKVLPVSPAPNTTMLLLRFSAWEAYQKPFWSLGAIT